MVVAVTDEIAAVLAGDRSELAASSTAERVAGILRTRIMEGSVRARQPAVRRGARPGARSIAEYACGRLSGSCATNGSPSTP